MIWLEKSSMNSKVLLSQMRSSDAVGDLERRRDQVLDVLAEECGLAQRAQAVVPRRIGGAERRAGAARAARRSCCPGRTKTSPSRAPPARCRRSATGSRACRSRSSSRDIARAGFRNGETDRRRCPANRDRMLPSRAPLGNSCLFCVRPRLSWRVMAVTWTARSSMTKKETGRSGEERLIARYFRPLAKHPGAFGLVDDAAAHRAACGLRSRAHGRRHRRRRAFLSRRSARYGRQEGAAGEPVRPRRQGRAAARIPAHARAAEGDRRAWLAPFARGLGADADSSIVRCSAATPCARPAR